MASEFGNFPSKPSTAGSRLIVEDLLDFFHHDDDSLAAGNSNSADSSASPLDSCNSSFPPAPDFIFSSDLCIPHDDLAEVEWLTNFVDEPFTNQKLQRRPGLSAGKTRPEDRSKPRIHHHDSTRRVSAHTRRPTLSLETPVPGKTRSKRTRAAPADWGSRLILVSPTSKPAKKRAGPTRDPETGEVRKCLHCAAEKTPQWRAGPMGPKTLCNACGVRYKSGRLVPEYRPAASPTFVQTQHSNSHRKVMEMRRQKELVKQQ